MPRRLRCSSGGFVYHVLNRAVGRATRFHKSGDYAAFEKVLRQAQEWVALRLLAYCILPKHWHLLVWPFHDGDLSEYLRWLTVTHTQRWHAHYHSAGTGPLYQGRFKSFPVQEDEHLLTVWRSVERNPLRAQLSSRADGWRWSSLWQRCRGGPVAWLDDGPVARPNTWVEEVNRVASAAELRVLRGCVQRGTPFGEDDWQRRTAEVLGLQSTLRPRGRPRKTPRASE